MASQVFLSTVLFLSLLPPALASEPLMVEWSNKTIGPDGPWNVVETKIGPDDGILMFAGAIWASLVLSEGHCEDAAFLDSCDAGGYDTWAQYNGFPLDHEYYPDLFDTEPGYETRHDYEGELIPGLLVTQVSGMIRFFETIGLGPTASVGNHTLIQIDGQKIAYPTKYIPMVAGCLSVGAVAGSHIIGDTNSVHTDKELTIPWRLYEDDEIPSASFGLHIGSTAYGTEMNGSLVFGGYDESRAVGTVLEFEGDFHDSIPLRKIGIWNIAGTSPFTLDRIDTILEGAIEANGDGDLNVSLEPCSPYITMPKLVCDNIAKHIPVTYDEELGLYIWNVDDPLYNPIIRSAATLSFEFEGGTIDVPFRHLNLTLESPLASEPVPYFPCSTGRDDIGWAVLGRAFLQDAFLGANWKKEVWWLAQASGPNIQGDSSITTIEPSDDTISRGSDDWEKSWGGIWDTSNDWAEWLVESADRRKSKSVGVSVGIGVGVSVGVIVLIATLVLFFWKRKPTSTRTEIGDSKPIMAAVEKSDGCLYELDHKSTPSELPSHPKSDCYGYRPSDGDVVHELE